MGSVVGSRRSSNQHLRSQRLDSEVFLNHLFRKQLWRAMAQVKRKLNSSASPAPPSMLGARSGLLPLSARGRNAGEKEKQQESTTRTKATVAARKRKRSAAEQLRPRIIELHPDLTYLQINRVKPATQKKYLAAVDLFLSRHMLKKLPAWDNHTWDCALQEHLDYLFDKGHGRADANAILAAVLWLQPGMGKKTKEVLPLSAASLAGWNRLEPGFMRSPLPYPVVLAMVLTMAEKMLFQEALLLWMLFETYLRCGECLTLHCEDIIPPVLLESGAKSHTMVLACSSDRGLMTKTGLQNVSLALDLQRQQGMAEILVEFAKRRPEKQPLWDITYDRFRNAFKMALLTIGAGQLEATPHTVRHGGASHDRFCSARSLQEVQQRGGWKSHDSVVRYDKHALITKQMAKLDPLVLRFVNLKARVLLDNCKRIFAPLYGTSQMNPEWCWTSSGAKADSEEKCEPSGTLASPSTSSTGRITTSRTLRSRRC